MSALLEVDGVTKTFRGLRAVDDVSITVRAGTVHGLIGPNGAGKSTLLGLVYGKDFPDHGSVRLAGQRIERLHPHQRARRGVGVKLQLTQVLPELDVLENLRVAARAVRRSRHGDLAVEIERVLELVGLQERRNERAATLSHGERKWLEIGTVLLGLPRLLLLDEPTSAMSPAETDRAADLIRRLRDDGLVEAVLVVEHDTRFISSLCDTISVLHQGQVLAEGSYDELSSLATVRDAYLGTTR